jgi:hypothetical protein
VIEGRDVRNGRESDNHERLRGAWWGMFVGDALGTPVQWCYLAARCATKVTPHFVALHLRVRAWLQTNSVGMGLAQTRPGPVQPDARSRLRCERPLSPFLRDHARSKRSRFITLLQAVAKSRTNACCESLHA